MGIEEKSLGFLIDELITTSMKCWYAQEDIFAADSDRDVATAAKRAQELNDRRNRLIIAIDRKFGDQSDSPTPKSYHTYLEK